MFLMTLSVLFSGAHGIFEVTHDITKYCKADIFSKVGKQTPCFVRFSTVGEPLSKSTVCFLSILFAYFCSTKQHLFCASISDC